MQSESPKYDKVLPSNRALIDYLDKAVDFCCRVHGPSEESKSASSHKDDASFAIKERTLFLVFLDYSGYAEVVKHLAAKLHH